MDVATAHLDPPFAAIDLEAFDANTADLLRRAGGKPVRLASKSVRCRSLIQRALDAGFEGILAFTLPEALWLADHGFTDLVVAYPTVDRAATARLPHAAITVMVDSIEHLELLPAGAKVCLDIDASWWPLGGRVKIGAKRSPVRTPAQAVALARAALERGLVVDGLMSYEAHIAGVGDNPTGRVRGAAIRAMQQASGSELAERRAAVVAAVRDITPLRFVNGGGTGSVERTAAEAAVTEVAAGSGLFSPTLFDSYRAFSARPAALFALPVVRKPDARTATVLGGGYPASGAAGADRLVTPLTGRLDRQEGAGEVQTPLHGAPELHVGDRVWFRHAKAGELCERFDTLHLVRGDVLSGSVPTYRGEGQCFL